MLLDITSFRHSMTNVDVSKLSYSELLELSRELEQKITAKRDEELKVLVDGFARKLQASGFTVDEALAALQPYTAATRQKSRQIASARVLYRDPANSQNTWSGRVRAAKWISDYEAQGRSRDEFRV